MTAPALDASLETANNLFAYIQGVRVAQGMNRGQSNALAQKIADYAKSSVEKLAIAAAAVLNQALKNGDPASASTVTANILSSAITISGASQKNEIFARINETLEDIKAAQEALQRRHRVQGDSAAAGSAPVVITEKTQDDAIEKLVTDNSRDLISTIENVANGNKVAIAVLVAQIITLLPQNPIIASASSDVKKHVVTEVAKQIIKQCQMDEEMRQQLLILVPSMVAATMMTGEAVAAAAKACASWCCSKSTTAVEEGLPTGAASTSRAVRALPSGSR